MISDNEADLGIRIPELDGDISFELILEPNGLHAGDGSDGRGLPVGDVADGSCPLFSSTLPQ